MAHTRDRSGGTSRRAAGEFVGGVGAVVVVTLAYGLFALAVCLATALLT